MSADMYIQLCPAPERQKLSQDFPEDSRGLTFGLVNYPVRVVPIQAAPDQFLDQIGFFRLFHTPKVA